MRVTTYFFFCLLVWMLPVYAASDADEPPVSDRYLERRLTEEKSYRIRPGDTLERVAHLLYGHRTWWLRLVKMNPEYRGFRYDGRLPVGKKLRYTGPKITNSYRVQPNDWLVRIAEWRYGSAAEWEKLYEKNKARISNPNLIFPGDVLYFSSDGTLEVEKRGTGQRQVIVQGVATEVTTPVSPWEKWKDAFLAGALLGLLVLFWLPVRWMMDRRRATRRADPLFRKVDEVVEYSDPDSAPEKEKLFKNVVIPFRVELPRFGTDLIRDEEGEVDRRPRYATLLGRSSKKYLKRVKKY